MSKKQFEALLWFIAEQLELQSCRETVSSIYFHEKTVDNKKAAILLAGFKEPPNE